MLDHLAGPGFENDDATEWLSYFLGKKYDAAYILATEALGLPLVERFDDTFIVLRTSMTMKKDESFEDSMINDKLDKLEMISGLLDAAFAHLTITYPNEDVKCTASQAVLALSNYWRMVECLILLLKLTTWKDMCACLATNGNRGQRRIVY
jgi:hypothetical protein